MIPWRRAPDGIELLAWALGFIIFIFLAADLYRGWLKIVLLFSTMAVMFAIGWVHHRWRMRNGLPR